MKKEKEKTMEKGNINWENIIFTGIIGVTIGFTICFILVKIIFPNCLP